LELKKGINNCILINDSYSADTDSLDIALNFQSQQTGAEKKTVILSDFLQSSASDGALYQMVWDKLEKHGVSRLIAIGPRISHWMKYLGTDNIILQTYENTEGFLEDFLSSHFRDENILIKGARLFGFERIVQLLELKAHQTVLEIDLSSIAHNLKAYQSRLAPATKVMAMVKAFAYGSGGAEISAILQYHKADYLGVAYADEGVELRRSGIRLPVMVMNTEQNAFEKILANNLEPEFYSFELLNAFDQYLQEEGLQQYPVHIEIETGMNRLGFAIDEIDDLCALLKKTLSFRVQSVFTHFAASEEPAQDAFTQQQFELFREAAAKLESALGYSFLKHAANSAAAIRFPEMQMDMVRLGIGLYGVDSAASATLDLHTVATLRSTISQLKNIKAGESVSYNRRSVVDKNTLVATVRIGYADGYPRRLGNGVGKVLVAGKLAPVIGTVCMDMFMVDVTDIPGVKEGDDVIIFGKDLSVEKLAEWAGTIPYEIMTGISQRVRRVYFEE
jgi:alanine racemase